VPSCTEPAAGPPDIGAYELVPPALPGSQCAAASPSAAVRATVRLRKVKLNRRKGTATLLLIPSTLAPII
jgi:hypothetical protein